MAAADDAKTMLLCVVTAGRSDASLTCAVSLLRLQSALMAAPERLRADLHFVGTLDEALNALLNHPTAVGALVVEATMGFDGEFPLRAMRSGLPVVVANHAMPRVDWGRVQQVGAGAAADAEPPQFWGNEYNVDVLDRDKRTGYARVECKHLAVAWVRREVLDAIAARQPGLLVTTAAGPVASFAAPGVYHGEKLDATARFVRLYGGEVWTDLDLPATATGPLEFGGCVGARSMLR